MKNMFEKNTETRFSFDAQKFLAFLLKTVENTKKKVLKFDQYTPKH